MIWDDFIQGESKKDYFKKLSSFLARDSKTNIILPPKEEIFTAFKECPFETTRVVLLGQDPYFNPGQAHGLSFSVKSGVQIPPSLQNIHKELKNDLSCPISKMGDLTEWAKQGVLLLNSVLTVRQGEPASHKGQGWETFTDNVLKKLNAEKDRLVFLMWGGFAKSKVPLIANPSHLILNGAHPSPLSAYNGFFGGKYFSNTNQFLERNGMAPINWYLGDENESSK